MTTPRPVADGLPAGTRLVLDPSVRRSPGGILVGGSPTRVVRLAPAGTRLLDRWLGGEPVSASPQAAAMARRLIDGGVAHPSAGPSPLQAPSGAPGSGDRGGPPGGLGGQDITVVIPVHDRPGGVTATLHELARGDRVGAVIVVDDGSADPSALAAAVALLPPGPLPPGPLPPGPLPPGPLRPPPGTASAPPIAGRLPPVTVIRCPRNRGPAAARNIGWTAATTELVAFVDADCQALPGWWAHLLPFFADGTVAAVAPRIVPRTDPGRKNWLQAYENAHSPLDMGARRAPVRPGSWVPYVPTAALIVRRDALDQLGGFDESLRTGEDVDLVWRLHDAGWRVRYEPGALVGHPMRPGPGPWLGQRVAYGRSAAPLARRHPGALTPLRVTAGNGTAWLLIAFGHPLAGASVALAAAGGLWRKVAPVGRRSPIRAARQPLPITEWARMVVRGQARTGRAMAAALRRTWWPLAVVGAVGSARTRRPVAAAVIVPGLIDWVRHGCGTGALRWLALGVADDAAYGLGVWKGCWDERSLAALRPRWARSGTR